MGGKTQRYPKSPCIFNGKRRENAVKSPRCVPHLPAAHGINIYPSLCVCVELPSSNSAGKAFLGWVIPQQWRKTSRLLWWTIHGTTLLIKTHWGTWGIHQHPNQTSEGSCCSSSSDWKLAVKLGDDFCKLKWRVAQKKYLFSVPFPSWGFPTLILWNLNSKTLG